MLPLTVKIIREGKMQLIPAKNLVRGDLIEISNGDKIPADVRIIESNGLKVDNSALTGEAQLLSRGIEATNKNPLESNNMAFFGTLCKNGRGKGIVTHIGENTFLGKIANLSSDKIKDKTPLRI
jgi:P-type E1-E2 ATPase